MSIFNIFKKKPKFKDDFFGELGYTTFKDSLKNFYDGSIKFNSQEIGINIDADEQGPTKAQKEFFLKLQDNYSSIKTEFIIPYLNIELMDWMDGNVIQDFESEFSIDGISLPRITKAPIEWSLTFYGENIKHYVTINFNDFKPQSNTVDG